MKFLDIRFVTLLVGIHHFVIGYGTAFEVFWNGPVGECKRFNIDIDVTKYGIKANNASGWIGPEITIFYQNEMGLYPSVKTTKLVNGGIPQKVNISKHILKCKEDVSHFIPDSNFDGPAVIDYESWRPLWDRNFDSKEVYKKLSRQLVKAKHPTWSQHQVESEAKIDFNNAARSFLTETIETGKSLRPKGKWGFYLFPDCYTDQGKRTCSRKEKNLNDELSWMFNASTGIYPSAYLPDASNLTQNKDYVFRTLQEGNRVRSKLVGPLKPMHFYSRIRYKNNLQFYSKQDLENTIKQTHDLGIEGVIIWQNRN